ncbi:DUF58 domain-containing protein [Georgenia sp. Z1491]|uniref:DUF58 domain-containing protein n=1 Tax=Georgenia sp. Z1491 TaxID=3416707 RepID=UPI003CF1BF02
MLPTPLAAAFAALGVVAVALHPTWTTLAIWIAVVVVVVLADALLAPSPKELRVDRDAPRAVRLGNAATVTVTVSNDSRRRVRGVLRDAWPPSAGFGDVAGPGRTDADRHRLDVPAGERRRLRTVLVPTRRGERVAGGVTVRLVGPLGLGARQATLDVPAAVRVLPAFRSRRHLPSRLARLREMDGRASVLVRGQGTEFDSLREYVLGDDVRSIDWRATARRGDVHVRTWRPERDRRVLVVVDSGRLSAARLGDAPRLDASIEAVLLLAALASHAGDRVDVVAVDAEVRARITGVAGARLMSSLADGLAVVEPALLETDWTTVAQTVGETLSQRALVVLLTAVDPSTMSSGLLPVVRRLARDHTVVVAGVEDPAVEELRSDRGDSGSVHDAAAAERTGLERDAVATRVRQAGADVVQGHPDEIAPRLADAYLALKAAGRL